MAEMTPEERVELVLDIVAEEILRQMREMQAAAQENLKSKFTIDTAREEMKRLGFHPDRWGHYTVGMHRLKFFKDAIRVEQRCKYASSEYGATKPRSFLYSELGPGKLKRIVKILKKLEADLDGIYNK